MSASLEEVTKQALDLSSDEKLQLAGLLLESADMPPQAGAEDAWRIEIAERVRAVKEGREEGIPYEEVLRAAEKLLGR